MAKVELKQPVVDEIASSIKDATVCCTCKLQRSYS